MTETSLGYKLWTDHHRFSDSNLCLCGQKKVATKYQNVEEKKEALVSAYCDVFEIASKNDAQWVVLELGIAGGYWSDWLLLDVHLRPRQV